MVPVADPGMQLTGMPLLPLSRRYARSSCAFSARSTSFDALAQRLVDMLREIPLPDPVIAVWHVANKILLAITLELLVIFENTVEIDSVGVTPCDLAGLGVDAFCFFATPLQERLRFCSATAARRLELDDGPLTGNDIPYETRHGLTHPHDSFCWIVLAHAASAMRLALCLRLCGGGSATVAAHPFGSRGKRGRLINHRGLRPW